MVTHEPVAPGIELGVTPHAFGDQVLYTKLVHGIKVDEQLERNFDQPRDKSRLESSALRNQILQAGGLFTPPLVEPTGRVSESGLPIFEVEDGNRRTTELLNILRELKKRLDLGELTQAEYDQEYRRFGYVTVESTIERLTDAERLRLWLYIHRERREWTLEEKENAAKSLIAQLGVIGAAAFLGISEREALKLQDVVTLAERIRIPGEAIATVGKDPKMTWAREIRTLRADIRHDTEVVDALVHRINHGVLRNSKDLRVVRELLPEHRDKVLDTSLDLVRDIAQPAGIADPVRGGGRGRPKSGTDFAALLTEMAERIDKVPAGDLLAARAESGKRREVKQAIERMVAKLNEYSDIVS